MRKPLSFLLALSLGGLTLTGCRSIQKLPPAPVISVSTADDFRAAKIKALTELTYLGNLTADVDELVRLAKADGLPDNVYAPLHAGLVGLATNGLKAVNAIDKDVTLQRAAQLKALLDPIIADLNATLTALQPVGASWKDRASQLFAVVFWVLSIIAKSGVTT